ncbi:phosphatase PAP2 family protein [Mycobacterium sp. pUA109]
MWVGWRQDWGWLAAVDTAALTAAHDIGVKHHGWVQFWQLLCTVFSPAAFRVVGMLAVVAALVRRRLRAALFLLVAVELSEVVTHVAKTLAERPRPVTALVVEPSWSFPSGHALGVIVAVLALLTVLLPLLGPAARPAAMAVGALIVVAVGVGRVALNVHHPSDVLAGWALGYLYFLLCRRVLRPQVG